jgi:hypothetical protein
MAMQREDHLKEVFTFDVVVDVSFVVTSRRKCLTIPKLLSMRGWIVMRLIGNCASILIRLGTSLCDDQAQEVRLCDDHAQGVFIYWNSMDLERQRIN